MNIHPICRKTPLQYLKRFKSYIFSKQNETSLKINNGEVFGEFLNI